MAGIGDNVDNFSIARQLYNHKTQAGLTFHMVTLADNSIAIFKDGRCIYVSDTSLDGMDQTLSEWDKIAKMK